MSIKLSPFLAFFAVTVHAAVWIEIFPCADPPRLSLVTVHAAVWIEMRFACNKFTPLSVTVHAAVWIEIKNKE